MTGAVNKTAFAFAATLLLSLASCERSANYEARKQPLDDAATGSMLGPTQNTSDTLNSHLVSGSIVSPGGVARK